LAAFRLVFDVTVTTRGCSAKALPLKLVDVGRAKAGLIEPEQEPEEASSGEAEE